MIPEVGQYVTMTPVRHTPNGALDYSWCDDVWRVESVSATHILLDSERNRARGMRPLLFLIAQRAYALATPAMVRAFWGDAAADALDAQSVQRAEVAALLEGVQGLE